MNGFSIGDRVTFTLANEIEAIVISIAVYPEKNEYEIAWVHTGERRTEWVKCCEIEKI